MKRKFTVSLLMLVSMTANAALEFNGQIKSVYVYENLAFVEPDGTPIGAVACRNSSFAFVFDATTAKGKNFLSSVIAAYTTKSPVRLTSTDLCDVYSSVPTLRDVWMK